MQEPNKTMFSDSEKKKRKWFGVVLVGRAENLLHVKNDPL
jgi:hypothetical protein